MIDKKIPFAITGMACHLPGADDLQQYWTLLKEGRSAIVRVPDERLHYDLYYEAENKEGKGASRGKTYMDQAGLVDYPAFNSCLCPFPMDVVGHLESGHLLMCETAAAACRQAGLDPFNLPYRRTGVYVGNNQSGDLGSELAYSVLVEEAADYLLDLPEFKNLAGEKARSIVQETVREIRRGLPRYGEGGLPSVAYHMTAAAVNRALGLDGPAMVFDAACSSSLQALAIATRDLALGNTEMAIVGGASFFRVDSLMIFSAAHSGSAKGCCPFCDAADGLIPAEGYVAVTLKTLERALADGDPIQAVIHGIGVSSDGKGKSLWAPSSDGQYEAIVRSYDTPETMGRLAYLEAHATSTAVGDLTELNALTRAFDGRFADGCKRPIGGVKANIGHALEAAGLAGLVKAVLVLQHNEAPAQIHCTPFNTKVDWEKLPFFVPQTAATLSPSIDGKPRMAGVNSFGIGGLNVHVALEEAPKTANKTSVFLGASGENSARFADAAVSDAARPANGLADAAREPIAVIGMGAVLPGARTLTDFAEVVFSGKNVFSGASDRRWNTALGIRPDAPDSYHAPCGRGGFIVGFEYDWRRHKIPPKQITNADPLQFLMMDAADAALADAGYDQKPIDRMRTGVLVGSSFDTDFSLALSMGFRHSHFENVLKETLRRNAMTDEAQNDAICAAYFKTLCERMTAILDETGSFTPSSLSSRITKTYNLMGGAVTSEAGDVGALAVLSEAANILRMGENDMMIVAAGSREMGLPTFIRMGLAGRLADGGDVRSALDEAGGKTVPGEGAGVFVLKRLRDALADGDPIRCVLHGVGCAGVSPKAAKGRKTAAFRRAIDQAWRQTTASRERVCLAELSNAPGEIAAAELAALAAEYRTAEGRPLFVGAVEPQFGTLFAASGAVSFFKAQAELAKRRMPKLAGYSRPNPQWSAEIDAVRVPTAEEPLAQGIGDESSFAAVSGWDPCGFVYHAVLEYRADGRYAVPEKLAEETAPLKPRSSLPGTETCSDAEPFRILRFGASDRTGLIDALRRAEPLTGPFGPDQTERLALALARGESLDSDECRARLAYAATTLAAESNGPLSRGAQTLLERKNLFYGRVSAKPGKIAFLFSGQGSQYSEMLAGLLRDFPPARSAADTMNQTLRKLGFPDFDDLTVSGAKLLGTDVFRTQLSLLCADWLVFRSLDALGIRPEIIAGHSFGEFPALVASGAWDFAGGATATKIRCDAIIACQDALGAMISTTADAAISKKFCGSFPGEAFPANINAPNQTVIGGRTEVLPKLEKLLKEAGFAAKIIPVPRPFHTPLMASVRPILAERLKAVPARRPAIRFISSVTNRSAESPEEILQNLADQMTCPIDYIGLVQKLLDEGATLLVECGPKRVLTGLHDKILAPRETDSALPPIRCFAPDAPGRDGGIGFYQLRALCEVLGYLDAVESDSKAGAPGAPARLTAETKARLTNNRESILGLLTERAVQMTPDMTVASSLRTLSAKRKEECVEAAAVLGVLPETLAAWLGGLPGGLPNEKKAVDALLEAAAGWQNPFEREITRLEAEHRAKRAAAPVEEIALTAAADDLSRPASGLFSESRSQTGDETAQAANRRFISPSDFYRVVSQKTEPATTVPNRKYRRFEIALMEKPLPPVNRGALNVSGRVLLYGDNPTARELEKRLAAPGREIVILPCSGDPEKDAQAAEKIVEEKPTLHLFLLASHDESLLGADGDWEKRRGVALGSYAVAQRWYCPIHRAQKLADASLVASMSFGGGFGVVAPSESVEAGALAGLIKSLDLEAGFPTNFAFRSKIVDFAPTDAPEYKADKILDVLAANVPYEVETGYLNGRRFLPRLVPACPRPADAQTAVVPEGLWVVTGGGRGITAHLARGIAKRYGLKLALIGSSPLEEIPNEWKGLDAGGQKALREEITRRANAAGENPQSVWNRTERAISLAESLDAFARDGIQAKYYAQDVADRAALEKLLETVRRDGPITGVLHGAGLEVSASFEKKDFAVVQKTFAIKTEGVKNLIELTRNDPLRHFLGLGSIAGRMGSLGQSDYSMANDGLAKLLDRLQAERPDCRVSLFHWGPWDEIGMAVRPEMKSNPILQQMTFLPPDEGLGYVLEELAGESEPVEKVFMAWDYFKLFYPLENNTPTDEELKADEVRRHGQESAARTEPAIPYKMERWEGRTVPIADVSESPFTPSGNAIIYGDNDDAAYLRAALERRGAEVLLLSESEDVQPLLKKIEEFWAKGPAPHLFIMSGRTNVGRPLSAKEWPARRHVHYMTPSWICRLWLRLLTRDGKLAGATLAAATAQGGGFGFGTPGAAPTTSDAAADGAQIAGILKCVYMENGLPGGDGVIVRILDAPDKTDPVLVAESLLAELVSEDVGIERSRIDGRRYAPRLLPVPARTYPATADPTGGVWVVTGGGRGISARAAMALGKRFGVSVHLLGTSPAPNLPENVSEFTDAETAAYKKQIIRDGMKKGLSPEKAWGPIRKAIEIERNLRAMNAAQVKAVYHQCDVLDVPAVSAVLDEIRRTDGPITGVLHGAGIDGIPATVRDIIDAQFADDEKLTAIKTDAALNLWELLRGDPLRYFIGFGSISGRFGSASASSYCSANDALCKMMARFRAERPDCASFAFHWHAWDEIGMMMRPVSYGSIKILKMELMPPDEGTAHLIDEIAAGGPSSEVIVTDRQYFSMFYSPQMEISSDTATKTVSQTAAKTGAETPSETDGFPLIELVSERRDGFLTAEAEFRPANDPFLLDHRLRDKPLLPAVISAESFCEAVQLADSGERPAAVENLLFKDGLVFNGSEPKRVKISVERTGPHRWKCRLCADFFNSKGRLVVADRVHSEGTVETSVEPAAPEKSASSGQNGDLLWMTPPDLDSVTWHPIEYLPKGAPMYHGPVFQQLRRCAFFERPTGLVSWGELTVLPSADFSTGRRGTWIVPASTLDACLYQCGVSVWYRTGGKIGLPKSLGRLCLRRAPNEGERCRVVCRSVSVSEQGATGEEVFQFALLGADRSVLLWGENYVCQVLTR